jgi:hypothetical protein
MHSLRNDVKIAKNNYQWENKSLTLKGVKVMFQKLQYIISFKISDSSSTA